MSFCDRKVWNYYNELLQKMETIQGDWFILSSADEHEQKNILRNSRWGIKIVESEKKVIFGKKARTMVCSNLFDPNIKEEWISSESGKTKGGKPDQSTVLPKGKVVTEECPEGIAIPEDKPEFPDFLVNPKKEKTVVENEKSICELCKVDYTGSTKEEHEKRPFHQRVKDLG